MVFVVSHNGTTPAVAGGTAVPRHSYRDLGKLLLMGDHPESSDRFDRDLHAHDVWIPIVGWKTIPNRRYQIDDVLTRVHMALS